MVSDGVTCRCFSLSRLNRQRWSVAAYVYTLAPAGKRFSNYKPGMNFTVLMKYTELAFHIRLDILLSWVALRDDRFNGFISMYNESKQKVRSLGFTMVIVSTPVTLYFQRHGCQESHSTLTNSTI